MTIASAIAVLLGLAARADGALSVSPSSGDYPLTVTFTGEGHFFELRFDDENVDAEGSPCYRDNQPCKSPIRLEHVYSRPGSYIAELYEKVLDDGHCCKLVRAGSAVITVTGGIPLAVSPASGAAPLKTRLSVVDPQSGENDEYNFDFGDGESGATRKRCVGRQGCTVTAEHVYRVPGVFHPRLSKANWEGCGHTPGGDCSRPSIDIVTAAASVSVTGDVSRTTFSGAPLKGDHPLSVEFTVGGPGGSFVLDRGDGTKPERFLRRPGEPNRFSAKYDVPGAYEARLLFNGRTLKSLAVTVAKSRCDGPKELWRGGKITPQTAGEMLERLGCPVQLFP